MTDVTPSPRIDTPYSASAISMVRFWWVMTMSCDVSRSSVQHAEQALQVGVVQRGLDLVKHVERRRSGLEDGDETGDRGQRAFTAGQQR